MRRISADHIFTINSLPIENGIITIDDEGTILSVDEGPGDKSVEYYKGIICPGFINTHCHLELSHLRGALSEKKGITGFITELMGMRGKFSEKEIETAIEKAEKEMILNGIVAVGDISNTNSTFKQKAKRNLHYHTFIEIYSMDPEKAKEIFMKGIDLEEQLQQFSRANNELSSSIVPHAPYTMSLPLLNLINDHAFKNKNILTIHNQESEAESELFISGSGQMYETFKKMGINTDLFRKTGENSLRSTLPYLNKAERILLVHNTFTTSEDIKWAASKHSGLKTTDLFWCTCPNANLFIENRLPDYKLLIENNTKVTVGTDSLASNWSLSIIDEIKTISKYNPHIPLQDLLKWATKNGAEFLGRNQLGTIEKGKRPGLNLLTDVENLNLTNKTKIIKIV
jgi:aminodeoxyfutalosine deaminase